jgi:DNA-binding response OmpR family regulator
MARLLIVCYETDLSNWASVILRSRGHEVAEAQKARDAMMLMRAIPFDALLIDIAAPEDERFDFLRELQREGNRSKIIAVSPGGAAISSQLALLISRALGADAILYRPFSSDELLDAVQAVLGA